MTMLRKTILLADDHPIFRAGVRRTIEEWGPCEVVAEAGDGETCIMEIERLRPDILIADLAMPKRDGLAVLDWVAGNRPETACVVLSMHTDRAFVRQAEEKGARAFIAKEDAAGELIAALDALDGPFYLSRSAGGRGTPVERLRADMGDLAKIGSLTPAEREILRLVSDSLTSKAIADRLGISYRTVQNHRQHIVSKLGLKGANKLLEFAVRHRGDI